MAKTFLGKEIREKKSSWTVVQNSVKKMTPKLLKQVVEIVIRESDYDNSLYAYIDLGEGYVSFTLDKAVKLQAGDLVEPSSVMVYKLQSPDGEATIERLFAKKKQ